MKEYKKKAKQQRGFEAMKGESSKTSYQKKDAKSYQEKDGKLYQKREAKPYSEKDGKLYQKREAKPYSEKDGKLYQKREAKPYSEKDGKSYQKRETKPYQEKVKIVKGCLVCQECGGCNGQQISYKEHVASKQARLEEALEGYAKPFAMIQMDTPSNYKTHVYRMFHHEKNGTPMSGLYSGKEGRLVKIDSCAIDDLKCQEIIRTIKGLLKSFKIKTYDVKSGHGLLRYVAVRRGVETDDIMVTLVLSSIIMPSKNNFVKELRRLHPEISTVLISENYKDVGNVYGDKEVNLYGRGFIQDTMCGKYFRIGAKSQYTMNPIQMKKLCNTIMEWGEFKGSELVLDAYCGVGTYGIVLSDSVSKVLSVEPNQDMYRDAIANVKKNQIKNIDVYRNNPAEFVMQVVKSEKAQCQVAIISQPYNGCGKEFMDAICAAKPKKILLVSRNIKHLRNELELLYKGGYKVKKAVGVDLHPWTERVQACVLLTRV